MRRIFIGSLDGLASHDWLGCVNLRCGRWF